MDIGIQALNGDRPLDGNLLPDLTAAKELELNELSQSLWGQEMSSFSKAQAGENQQTLFPEFEVRSRSQPSELVKKVQSVSREALEDALEGSSSLEKKLVAGMQDALIAGDTASFSQNMGELYQALSYQSRSSQEKSDTVRADLRAVERVIRQKCGVDINIDLTNDDRAIVRLRPDTLVLELSKDAAKVRRVEDAGGAVILDNSKEVVRPSAQELARVFSDKMVNTRQF